VSLDLSVVIPTLNAARTLAATLDALGDAPAEVVIVDGGSADGTVAIAAARPGVRVATGALRGRGLQLASGAVAARSGWLLFLHADTRLAPGWATAACAFMADPTNGERAAHFRFALDDPSPEARRLERWVAWRCERLAMPYGDQGLLLSRDFYRALGGFRADLPLMEDVDLVRRIGRRRLVALDAAALTSAERWRQEGWWRRSARNLACLALWFAGVPPRRIAALYGR